MAPNASTNNTVNESPTLIGWQGIFLQLPPDWNLTSFSMDRNEGYLKVDSPGTMFVQVKWSAPRQEKPRSAAAMLWQWTMGKKSAAKVTQDTPDLKSMLESFLKQTGKAAKKSKATFDYKIKPEAEEGNGERIARNFTWSGGGQGQGKIWYCRGCGRVVIAQVVGQAKDNSAAVAAQLFSSLRDHNDDDWDVWALYDFVGATPKEYALKAQKLMSGYLKLDFERPGGQRICLERWGLANVTKKKFTLREWFANTCRLYQYKTTTTEAPVQEHIAVRAKGAVRGLAVIRALREAVTALRRPALRYDAFCWECDETNKLYTVQVWHNAQSEGLAEEVVARCECH